MALSRKQAIARGEQAIERPKGEMAVTLYHGKTGVTLRYQGRVVARTTASRVGRAVAPYVAQALGVKLPSPGSSAKATVSSGVMFRVLSICTLDLRDQEALVLLQYLLQEAQELRGFRSAAVD